MRVKSRVFVVAVILVVLGKKVERTPGLQCLLLVVVPTCIAIDGLEVSVAVPRPQTPVSKLDDDEKTYMFPPFFPLLPPAGRHIRTLCAYPSVIAATVAMTV